MSGFDCQGARRDGMVGCCVLWWDGFDGQVGKVLIERYGRASQGMAWIA